mgnify:FL=1
MKIYHKFLLYQNKLLKPYVRILLGLIEALTYLASLSLIVGVVYEHGFPLSIDEVANLQTLYKTVWIIFLIDVTLHISLEYRNTKKQYRRLAWILSGLLYLTLVPVIFHRPEEEGAILHIWEFLHGKFYHLLLLLVLSFLNLSNGLVRLLGRRTNPSLILAVSFMAIILIGAGQNTMFDSPLLVTRVRGLKWEEAFIKRVIDIIISLILCIPTVIVTLIVAIADMIWDRGPIFYTQERLTQNGKTFRILKFRSMKVDSETDGARLAAKDDDRITKIGKVLRATHLDELPQVFNILMGQMSVVGPRPERPEIAAQYEEEIPEFRFRLKVKAGLTGYAQVYGKYNTTPYDKLKLDLYYIQHYKVWTDIQLILMTFKIMFLKENTEGVEKEQKTASIKKKVK